MWAQKVPQQAAPTAGPASPRGSGGRQAQHLGQLQPRKKAVCPHDSPPPPLPGSCRPSTRNNLSGKARSRAEQANLPGVPTGVIQRCQTPASSCLLSPRRHSELHFVPLIERFSIICLHQLYVNEKGLNVFVNEKVTLLS